MPRDPQLPMMEDTRVLLKDDRPHYSFIVSDSVVEALRRGEVLPELREAVDVLLRWKTPQGERQAG